MDVFFVISGYLITSQIVKNIDSNSFSLVKFYEKRVRRIIPALITLVFFTILAGAWLLESGEYEKLALNATASVLSFANIFYYFQSGYFDTASDLKPLLHTWSLSIEEQFYIIFPLLVYIISSIQRKRVAVFIGGLFILSFSLNVQASYQNPVGAFYLVQHRAWELLAGSLLSFVRFRPGKKLANLFSGLGLFMILAAILLYSEETLFPGFAAIIPVLSAVLIILADTDVSTATGRVLSWKPMVFIGKISYSLYLWHWPVFVLGRILLIQPPGLPEFLAATIFIFGISILSWKYVETPFRSQGFLKRRFVFILAGYSITGLILFMNFMNLHSLFRNQYVAGQSAMEPKENWQNRDAYLKGCSAVETDFNYTFESCPLGNANIEPSFILWGDSHASAMAPGIIHVAQEQGASGVLIFAAGCPPLLEVDAYFSDFNFTRECSRFNDEVIRFIDENRTIETVILSARWPLYGIGERYKLEGNGPVTLYGSEKEDDKSSNLALFQNGLLKTLDRLSGRNLDIYLLYGAPEVGFDVPTSYSIALQTNRDINQLIGPTVDEYQARNAEIIAMLDGLRAAYSNFQILFPSTLLCGEARCLVASNFKPLYMDDDHLSTFGSLYISDIYGPIFAHN